MPDKKTLERARKDEAAGKSPSTQAGEFVHEEIDHIRDGKHGARSAKQAIAIGLSKARQAGIKVPPKKGAPATAKPPKAGTKPSARRSRATTNALKREGKSAASHRALSRQAKSSHR